MMNRASVVKNGAGALLGLCTFGCILTSFAAERSDPFGSLPEVDGLSLETFASFEDWPQLTCPTSVAAAPDGAVYVLVDRNGAAETEPGMGKILRLVDDDHDGRADEMTEFVPDLNTPRGAHFVDGTLYVMHPSYVSAFRDTDGDGVANQRRTLAEGVGFELSRNAGHTSNDVRMGIDGWLYLAIGDHGVDATGADGSRVKEQGGCVLRIRPDGSELELVARGTRNIYDVVVSPRLELLARDNTNDGGGWNMRVHHVTPLAHMGYPNLFKFFSRDAMPPLQDDGGGAGAGALYLQEPGFPERMNDRPLTISWGKLYAHYLEPYEATFINHQEVLFQLRKLLDLDVDGSSRLYATTWEGAGARVADPDHVGRVIRIVPTGWEYRPFPDIESMADGELLEKLSSRSQVLRLNAQRELIHREGDKIDQGLRSIALDENKPLDTRIAALLAVKQRRGGEATDWLVHCVERAPELREQALRALADRKSQLEGVPVRLFIRLLEDPDPKVRLQAVIGLTRLGAREAAPEILPLGVHQEPFPDFQTVLKGEPIEYGVISHTARRALIKLEAVDTCLEALRSEKLRSAALGVLRFIHKQEVVDGLISAMRQADPDDARLAIATALMRLYHKEAPWDVGNWWGTRPRSDGPYFKPTTWEQTPRIATALEQVAPRFDREHQKAFLAQLRRHNLPLEDLDLEIEVDPFIQLIEQETHTAVVLSKLLEGAANTDRATEHRKQAFEAALRVQGARYRRWVPQVLEALGEVKKSDLALYQWMKKKFVRSPEHQQGKALWMEQMFARHQKHPWQREVISEVVLRWIQSPLTPDGQRRRVTETIRDAEPSPELLEAIGAYRVDALKGLVEEAASSSDARLRRVSEQVLSEFEQSAPSDKLATRVAELGEDQVLELMGSVEGDAELGEKLFDRQGCVTCHTTSNEEPLKGPYLGTVGSKFSRAELALSILRPGAEIAQGFQGQRFTMKDGSMHQGFVTDRSGGTIELRNVTGAVTTLDADDVAKVEDLGQSMMPRGLTAGMTIHELASLLDYLESLE